MINIFEEELCFDSLGVWGVGGLGGVLRSSKIICDHREGKLCGQ